MVAGIAATYQAFNYIQQLHAALSSRTDQTAPTLDTTLMQIANGPAGLGAAHRDLGRRLNDQLIADVQPTPSVVAGVDGPCASIDAALAGLRKLQAGLDPALPKWTPPPAPACGR